MKYYIISGEASGDLHGSNLMRALLQHDSDAHIRFWGGDRMAAVAHGNDNIVQVRHIRDLAFMGLVEVLSHLPTITGNISFCKRDIQTFNPDVVVFIDYPGFNLKIAKFTHSCGFRNVYYISPQIWAWKRRRIHSMRRIIDSLCCILPFEQKFYQENDFPQAVYVGHPLLDEVQRFKNEGSELSARKEISALHSPFSVLLPGSRKQELSRTLPLMVQLARRHPQQQFAVAAMSLIGEEFYRRFIPTDVSNITLVFDQTYNLLSAANAAVVCSGTATLETALFRVPQVVCYRCNRISALIARLLIGHSIKYISLVNLISDKPVVTELIQNDFNINRLDEEFRKITSDQTTRTQMLADYDTLADILQNSGASERTALQIINTASK